MHTPSPIDLKPLLDRCIAEFPGEDVSVSFEKSSHQKSDYCAAVRVSGQYYFGSEFEAAFQKAKAGYDPRKAERVAAANAMRVKADQIERGEIAI